MPLFRACPNCSSQIHVRKLACPCDHSVFCGSKPLTTRNASRKSDVGAARALETEQQTAKRRKSNREHMRDTRILETEEQTAKRRKSDRKRVRETRALETEDQTAKRRKSNREHVRETRVLETEEQTAKRRKSNREHMRETRVLETEEQTAKRRKSDRKRVAQRRSNVSVEAAIDLFITKTKQGPDYVCTSCHRLMYRANVVSLNKCKLANPFWTKLLVMINSMLVSMVPIGSVELAIRPCLEVRCLCNQ